MNDPPPPAAPQARGEGALSPLSGSYLLIVVAEPHVEQHKDTILSRISKGTVMKDKLGLTPGRTTPDGLFTLSEVACLGACVNAPMMQINDDYYLCGGTADWNIYTNN